MPHRDRIARTAIHRAQDSFFFVHPASQRGASRVVSFVHSPLARFEMCRITSPKRYAPRPRLPPSNPRPLARCPRSPAGKLTAGRWPLDSACWCCWARRRCRCRMHKACTSSPRSAPKRWLSQSLAANQPAERGLSGGTKIKCRAVAGKGCALVMLIATPAVVDEQSDSPGMSPTASLCARMCIKRQGDGRTAIKCSSPPQQHCRAVPAFCQLACPWPARVPGTQSHVGCCTYVGSTANEH